MTARFRRDLKRERKGQFRKLLEIEFDGLIARLAQDDALAPRFHDHALIGELSDCRECHVRPDLLLIYRKPATLILELVRLGSHSELKF